jgi:hypothetical protein
VRLGVAARVRRAEPTASGAFQGARGGDFDASGRGSRVQAPVRSARRQIDEYMYIYNIDEYLYIYIYIYITVCIYIYTFSMHMKFDEKGLWPDWW